MGNLRPVKKIQLISMLVGGTVIIFFGYYMLVPMLYLQETYHREERLSQEDTALKTLKHNTQTSTSSVHIAFVGDMMFDRYIRKMANKYSADFLFSCIDPFLARHDMVVGNLEGPITTKPSTSMDTKIGSPENYYFTFPTTTASLLFKHGIKLVNIGNNHINNQGPDGVLQTKQFLKNAQVNFFGGLLGDSPHYRTTVHGIPISFINYNQFGGDPEEIVVQRIKEEKLLQRVVIIYAHWGEEYQDVVEPVQITAKLFADSGADLIVGSHPHIVQSHEVIGKTPVYYSLGNFIFDQYFDQTVTHGLALSVDISGTHAIVINEYPVVLTKDGRTCLEP